VRAGTGDGAALRLVLSGSVDAFGDREARCVSCADGFERSLIALQIGAADAFEFGERQVDHLGVAHHLREARGAELERVAGVAALAFDPTCEILHRFRGGVGGKGEVGLQLLVFDFGERFLAVALVILRQATERGLAVVDECERERRP
jgi:hypothetical protein